MIAISASEIEKLKMSMFSAILAGDVVFATGSTLFCQHQRKQTWAVVLESFLAISVNSGTWSTAPLASGLQACTRML